MDYEAFADFTASSVRLMVWYARQLIYHRVPAGSLDEALDTRVDILRKTRLYDGRRPAMGLDPPNAEWEQLKERLASELKTHSEDEDTRMLEDGCLSIVWPLVEPRSANRPLTPSRTGSCRCPVQSGFYVRNRTRCPAKQ